MRRTVVALSVLLVGVSTDEAIAVYVPTMRSCLSHDDWQVFYREDLSQERAREILRQYPSGQ